MPAKAKIICLTSENGSFMIEGWMSMFCSGCPKLEAPDSVAIIRCNSQIKLMFLSGFPNRLVELHHTKSISYNPISWSVPNE